MIFFLSIETGCATFAQARTFYSGATRIGELARDVKGGGTEDTGSAQHFQYSTTCGTAISSCFVPWALVHAVLGGRLVNCGAGRRTMIETPSPIRLDHGQGKSGDRPLDRAREPAGKGRGCVISSSRRRLFHGQPPGAR